MLARSFGNGLGREMPGAKEELLVAADELSENQQDLALSGEATQNRPEN